MVKPGGIETMTDLISEGDAARPSNWVALRSRFKPEPESVCVVVGAAWMSGLKVSFSQPTIGG